MLLASTAAGNGTRPLAAVGRNRKGDMKRIVNKQLRSLMKQIRNSSKVEGTFLKEALGDIILKLMVIYDGRNSDVMSLE